MKRGAARQITRHDDDRDDDERGDDVRFTAYVFVQAHNTNYSRITIIQEEPQQGLQVADAAVLAKRPYVARCIHLEQRN